MMDMLVKLLNAFGELLGWSPENMLYNFMHNNFGRFCKLLNVLNFLGIPLPGERKLAEKVNEHLEKEEQDDNVKKKKRYNFVWNIFMWGPLYIGWLIVKWAFKIMFKPIKKIFRRKRA